MAVTMSLALTACAPTIETDEAAPTPASTAASPAPTVTQTAPSMPVGVDPASVSIPAIGIDEPLIPLGLNADASMEVPSDSDDVGWYTGGGRPGGRGPVVIAGHVDSPTGPAVFLRLNELQPGDTIDVVDVDGALHTYVVTETADYPKADFPTARVFGAVATDEIRLVTCGGFFDSGAASYVDNHVVFAAPAA
jgi:LPXTG-site transpeptidase (sortase) family protein